MIFSHDNESCVNYLNFMLQEMTEAKLNILKKNITGKYVIYTRITNQFE